MQWGIRKNVYFDEDHFEVITFPKAFPHKCLTVMGQMVQHEYMSGGRILYVHSYNRLKVEFLPGYTNGGKGYLDFFWYAIGY